MPWFHLKCHRFENEFDLDYNYLEKDFKSPSIKGVLFCTPNVFSVKCPQCHRHSEYHTTYEDIVNPGPK